MKKAQLNAISRAYAVRAEQEKARELDARGLAPVYAHQSVYKTLGGFLRASDAQLRKCAEQAAAWAARRREQLATAAARCGTTPDASKWAEVGDVERAAAQVLA